MSRLDMSRAGSVAAGMTRRCLLQGIAGGVFVLGTAGRSAWSAGLSRERAGPEVLSGTQFDLHIGAKPIAITGQERTATVVNGRLPAPLLRWREGDRVTLRVTNHLPVRSSIHWHGMILPADMDGVPGISFAGIASGATYVYRFDVNQYGTYWYHAHSRFQEQTGLYGPIVIEPRRGERFAADREHVILLSDWTDLDPEHIFATLKKQSDYYNFRQRTLGDLLRDARRDGWRRTLGERRMWGAMRMDPTDLLDVSGYAYTYLMNGTAPAGNWTALFQPGERVRLRLINGSAMSLFDLRIPGLKLTVVAADGQDVEPVTVDELRIGTAETYDVIVEPRNDRAYTIFAQSMDRTGYARGTLAPRTGMEAAIPELDPRPSLAMSDMGMSHDSGSTSHAVHATTRAQDPDGRAGAHHDSGTHGAAAPGEAIAHGAGGQMLEHDTSASVPLQHARTEYGPGVDALAEHASTRLDDPGIGLRDNGRRVLTYADLRTIGGPIDRRMPGREIELHLTGHMERFMWSFDGRKFSEAEPLRLRHGERLRITLVNDTMMTHPIHLHGMWSELETSQGGFQVRKHTVLVQPAQRLSYAVTADALGRWAYHCHLLYHMEAGMFREVQVTPQGASHPGRHE